MSFTFKTEQPTGKWRSFDKPTHYIKYNKKIVGQIDEETFRVRLQVIKKDINEDGNPNCPWKWAVWKPKNTLQEAKDWLNSQEIRILNYINNRYNGFYNK